MPGYVQFFAPGIPQPKGSTRAFVKSGRAVVTSDNPKLKGWQRTIAKAAPARVQFDGPVSVFARFLMPHPTTGKRRQFHTVRPDVDKLLRAVNDSLTGVLWKDDAQIVNVEGEKHYANSRAEVGAHIMVHEVDR